VAFKDLFTEPTQLSAGLLLAPLNRHIIIQLFPAKAESIARTSLLLLWCSEMAILCAMQKISLPVMSYISWVFSALT
jgi:hypothetical protein